MLRAFKPLVVIGCLGFLAGAVPAQNPGAGATDPIAGRWTGSMTLGQSEYPINLWFDGAGSRRGRFQVIGHSTANNPLRNVTLAGSRISFDLPSRPQQQFRGTIAGRRMIGTVRVSALRGSFSVQRAR